LPDDGIPRWEKLVSFDLSRLRACGNDVIISDLAEIRRPRLVSVGNHSAIDSFVSIATAAEIGDYVHIAPHVSIIGDASGLIRMGHFTNLAAGCRVICGSDKYLGAGLIGSAAVPTNVRDEIRTAPVTLENFANVGSNAVLMPGVTLAVGSVVGACSFVTHSTEPWTIYTGIPARPVKMRKREIMLANAKALGYKGL
jgi:acetyltransferase-like isoleucine patch superfamily enzyme